ncbi:ATP-binding protein [Defluviitalea phaphyphila]|uniref:ATP-binding protein n=1 Tax=Defluviitalea phaphyphila TaxID=1473580 RepID=UPI000730873B|nr:ATP-binding protein [Defluviitalea phaphyphila]
MKNFRELTYKELKKYIDPSKLEFDTTDELEPLEGVIGQEKAVKAIEFGLEINRKGYNIYISGPTGLGKTSYAKTYTEKIAKKSDTPDDWCYVYNYANPSSPLALNFPKGLGKEFKDDMDELIEFLLVKIPKVFNEEDYEKEKSQILKDYQSYRDELIKKIKDAAKEVGCEMKIMDTGIYFIPVIDGEPIDDNEYENLDEDKKSEILEIADEAKKKVAQIIKELKKLEENVQEKIENLEYNIGLITVGKRIDYLKEKYKKFDKVIKYLEYVQEDILANIKEFLDNEEDSQISSVLPFVIKKNIEDLIIKYRVNLFVDNSNLEGAPVIIDFHPTYNKLIGKIEYENELGNLVTDFTKIKPGLFHQANGGYLILQAIDVLKNAESWEALKRVLKTKEVKIENLRDLIGISTVSSLKPEPIPIEVKVILIGSREIYNYLYEYDDDFKKLFKIRADFDIEMANNLENIKMLARFIHAFCIKENMYPFDKEAVIKLIEYSSRMVENQEKLTTNFNNIVEILYEANTWAKIDGKDIVTAEYIKKAIIEKEKRCNLSQEKIEEMIKENIIMIDCHGEKIGQINGLAVIDTGDYKFAKPSKITATTYIGQSGIINIEKESEMSGKIHDKGVHVLAGYLGETYAQDFPLTLSCRICFEQNYYGIDGDSASSAELYAILSSLSGIPINQGIAVTGSINQKGEIQPIGGVSYKIEGFFKFCKSKGLTGEQGVIIPYQNIKDLVLNDEVIEAVKQGKFHIYPISHVNEGMEILMGVAAGNKNEKGKFSKESIHGKVYDKLKRFYKISLNRNKNNITMK